MILLVLESKESCLLVWFSRYRGVLFNAQDEGSGSSFCMALANPNENSNGTSGVLST